MFLGYTEIIQQYNNTFESLGIKIRITKWVKGELTLSTGIILTGAEIRRFRSRLLSPLLPIHFDDIYSIYDNTDRNNYIKLFQSQYASILNKQRWDDLSRDEKTKKQQHMRDIRQLVDYSSKRKIIPWNKGKTKDTDYRLAKNSKDRQGANNPRFGSRMSEDEKMKKSDWVKSRIKSGEWTPCIHNSRTHFDCEYKGRKFRSSWEAMYASVHPSHEFETVRISYTFDGKPRIYIVDFVDVENRLLIEIKPSSQSTTDKVKAKIKAAEDWCDINNYQFRLIDEQYFIDNFDSIDFDHLTIPNIRQKLTKIKYEANKKNRNT